MSVNEVAAVDRSSGNGTNKTFAYTFRIVDEAEIQVFVGDTEQTLTVDYTVTGVGDSGGGNVVFLTAPANLSIVTRRRKQTFRQSSIYTSNEAYPSQRISLDFDKLVMMAQQVKEELGRAIKYAAKSSLSGASAQIDEPVVGSFARGKVGGGIDWATVVSAGSLSVPVPINEGGTGAITAAAARAALSVGSVGSRVVGLTGQRNTTTTQFDLVGARQIQFTDNANTGTFVYRGLSGTITIDALTAGPAANGRDQAGAFTNPSTVYLYYIWNGSAVAGIASVSPPFNGPTLPSGYTHWAYATAVIYTTEFKAVRVSGNHVYIEATAFGGLTATSATFVSTSSMVPSEAVAIFGDCEMSGTSTAGGFLDATLTVSANPTAPLFGGVAARLFQAGINSTSQAIGGFPFTIPAITTGFYYSNGIAAGTSVASAVTVRGYTVPNGDAG